MKAKIVEQLINWLIDLGLNKDLSFIFLAVAALFLIVILAFLADIIAKKIILVSLNRIILKSKTQWDDILLKKKVFNRLAHIAPAVVIYYLINFIYASTFPSEVGFIQSGIVVFIIIVSLMTISSFLSGLHDIYYTLPISKNRPISGYIQLVKIIFYFIGGILILSILFDKELGYFFTGLGAFAAVLLLVFKDTILGFVSSIQLSANNMVKPGDWISMPKQNTDGIVLEINLTTVKIQNWDKTISTIPTYSLISESFNNWKGMEESGGRRIKRHLNIDMKSIKFCDEELIQKFMKIKLLNKYLKEKIQEITIENQKKNISSSDNLNLRHLTNIGIFRKYIEEYLSNHPKIHNNMTFLIRQLQPTERGIPLEIYVFSKDQEWVAYEALQSDIFDHLLAILPEFELRVFQNPTGDDFSKLAATK